MALATITTVITGLTGPTPAAVPRTPSATSLSIAGASARQEVEIRDGDPVAPSTDIETRLRLARTPHEDAMGAARALAEGSLTEHGMPSWLPGNAQTATVDETSTPPSFFAIPAGDLNADGTADAIGLLPSPGGLDGAATVAGLDGANGSTLWTNSPAADLIWAWPGRFGFDAQQGVLVETYRFIGETEYATLVRVELHLIAFDGGGAMLWERTFVGYLSELALPVLHEYPFMNGTMNASPSGATDLLIDQLSLVDGLVWFEAKDRAFVIDGADGSTVSEYEHGGTNIFPIPFPASDYSGDGLHDVLVLDHPGDAASMVGGVSGQPLWRSLAMNPERWEYWVEIEDATGDGVGDIAVWEPPDVALLSGADGNLVWRQPSMWPREIGDVDRDGLADVGALEFSTSIDAWSLRSAALSGRSGTELFATRHAIDLPGEEWRNWSATALWMPSLGDVDDEATTDTGHMLNVTLYDDDDNVTYRSENAGVVSGRNGTKIWEGDLRDLYPLGATLDGRGTDLLRAIFSEDGASVDLEGRDGRTGDALWASTLNFGAPAAAPFLYVQDFDGDGRSDLLFSTARFGQEGGIVFTAYLIDGATGARRW